MRVISLTLFVLSSVILVSVSFSSGSTLIAAIGGGASLGAAFFILKRKPLALSAILCAYVFLASCLTLLHQRPTAMLFVVIASLLGWDVALIEKDLRAFPQEERRRFMLRHFLLTSGITSCALGIALLSRLFRLRFGFTGTLSIALAAIFLLIVLLRSLHSLAKQQHRRRTNS